MMLLLRCFPLLAILAVLVGCVSGPTDAERAAAAEHSRRVDAKLAAIRERSEKAAAERYAPVSEEQRREVADAERAKRLSAQDAIRQRLLAQIRDSKFPQHDKAELDRLEEKWSYENRISDVAEAERRKTPEQRAAEAAAFRKQNEEREARRVEADMVRMRAALEDRPTLVQHPARTVCKKSGETQECTHYPAYTTAVPAKRKAGNPPPKN